MASVIDPEKRKKLLAKGSPYTPREKELVAEAQANVASRKAAADAEAAALEEQLALADDNYANILTQTNGEPYVSTQLPEGGKGIVPTRVLETPTAYAQDAADANPQTNALKAWLAHASNTNQAWNDFMANRGTTADVFTGGSSIQAEREARKLMEMERGERGRLNQYARDAERGKKYALAQNFRDVAVDRFDVPNSNVDEMLKRYMAIRGASGGRLRQKPKNNPFAYDDQS